MEFFLEFLGYDDGCYNDWSLDLLVAKKVSGVKWIIILIACNVYIFSLSKVILVFVTADHYLCFVVRFWKLRGFPGFHSV